MQMVIGTRAWSSWSLRAWLAAKRAGADFEDILVPLRTLETSARLKAYSPGGQCPVLIDGDVVVWESLAICEYLAERFPQANLWPPDTLLRAQGRAACAQMSAGFRSLRGECSMDLERPVEPLEMTEATQGDVRAIVTLWRALLDLSGGPFLLGPAWTIADAFYTPVASRFRTYVVDLSLYGDTDGACAAYAARLLQQPEYLEWERLALAG